MKLFIKRAGFALCIVAFFGACETYDDDYHRAHRHTYYGQDRPYAYYGYNRAPAYRYDTRANYSGDWPYTTERAYVRPGGVRVYRY